ncbi:MAG: PAS domain S-box-containing protein [Bacteriovoracaceae bacterium]|jgi:PAS domain S-box-containing protein
MKTLEILKSIGDFFPYCLTIVDMKKEGRPCIYTNKKFLENTDYNPAEAIDKNLSYLQGPLTSQSTILFMREAFDKKEACIQDVINYKKDGTPFLNRLLMVPIIDGDNFFYLGFQNDITTLKGLHYKEESLKSIDDSEIRHMIFNPLTQLMELLSLKLTSLSEGDKKEDFSEITQELFDRIICYALDVEEISNFSGFDPLYEETKEALFA